MMLKLWHISNWITTLPVINHEGAVCQVFMVHNLRVWKNMLTNCISGLNVGSGRVISISTSSLRFIVSSHVFFVQLVLRGL
jgi:hypothetical protein